MENKDLTDLGFDVEFDESINEVSHVFYFGEAVIHQTSYVHLAVG